MAKIMRCLSHIPPKNLAKKRVLLRCDFNVPRTEDGAICGAQRLERSCPTIRFLRQHGSHVTIISHAGRPHHTDPNLSLKPVAQWLEKTLQEQVTFSVDGPPQSALHLLENIRFHPEEYQPTDTWIRNLAQWGDIYVNDAFAMLHRQHGSVYALAKHFEQRYAGLLIEEEVQHLQKIIAGDTHPRAVVIGGSKLETKLPLLERLHKQCDIFFVVGAMAFPFLNARYKTSYPCTPAMEAKAEQLLEEKTWYLPQDFVVGQDPSTPPSAIHPAHIPLKKGLSALDIGPKTIEAWQQPLDTAALLFWNGPAGVYESPYYHQGTDMLAQSIGDSPGITIAGGGDSVQAITKAGYSDRYQFLSTGGGATLAYLAGQPLPSLKLLQ